MQFEEQEALLAMWTDFLEGRRPTGGLMREFYFNVVSPSPYYRYGMAPEVFDLLVNGPFEMAAGPAWSSTPHRVASRAA